MQCTRYESYHLVSPGGLKCDLKKNRLSYTNFCALLSTPNDRNSVTQQEPTNLFYSSIHSCIFSDFITIAEQNPI